MTGNRRIQANNGEQGVAMFMALFALLLLSAVAFGLMYMANTETSINSNYRNTQQSYFAARAGIEIGRMRITPGAPNSIAVPTDVPTTANGNVIYLLNPTGAEVVQPWNAGNAFFDTELCHERFQSFVDNGLTDTGAGIPCASVPAGAAWYQQVASVAPYNNSPVPLGFKWVRITKKSNNTAWPYQVSAAAANTIPICWDGTQELPLPAGMATCESTPPPGAQYLKSVHVLTSLAVGANGGARRMAQMEVALTPPFMTNAAVDSQDNVVLKGNLTVNATDYCSCTPLLDAKGNQVYSNNVPGGNPPMPLYTNRAGATCDPTKYGIFSAGSVGNPNNSESVIAGTTDAQGRYQPIAQNQAFPYNISQIINTYKGGAVNATGAPYNYDCSAVVLATGNHDCGNYQSQTFGVPPTMPNPSPPGNPVGPANMAMQTTYVPGNLKITSHSQGNGILIVDGDLEINGGLDFYGLILVKGIISFTGGGAGGGTNIQGAVLAGQESVVNLDTALGGSANIRFNACALNRDMTGRPPNRLASREVMY